ncbi:aminoacyl-tRNA hydrolase [Lactococcus taiwanensis]|uniref:Peptidyl-tRNA hydrolase n=1 Tax=Lactococcus taiwanensis TaxID=1151742 RepID=A0AA45QRF1_9LACT|nr:aminoacyl-tRNA hydrolase [Lactococcus taiwanensis]QSE76903.1 aminoacyl-tRNA hydrolase [Lactococcus taiwanensis]
MTKMIVGLGNPGDKYDKTRHNMGFMALDLLAKELNVEFREEKTFMSLVASTFINGEKMFLVKPLTFMNESGRAVAPLLKYHNLDPADLTVIHDDLDSPVGRVRLRQKGSSGGQNGIKSVITHVGTQAFNRVKIGIGRPKNGMTVVNHVLSRFDNADKEIAQDGIFKAVDAMKFYIENGDFQQTMNKFN